MAGQIVSDLLQHRARSGAGSRAVLQGEGAPHQHVADARRLFHRVGVLRQVPHLLRVKDRDVGDPALLQGAPVLQAQDVRRQAGDLVHRVLQGHQPVVPGQLQEAGEGAEAAGMGVGPGDGPVIGDVTMDDAGVPLLTIDARDGSVIQRIQAGWAASMGSKDIK